MGVNGGDQWLCATRRGVLRLVSVDSGPKGDVIITLTEDPSLLRKLFGARGRELQFIGSCTVWHQLPRFRRAPSYLENRLAEVWERDRFKKAVDTTLKWPTTI